MIVVPDPPKLEVLREVKNNRIVVVGDADWLGDWIIHFGDGKKISENNALMTGMVEWLAAGEELAALQVKGSGFKPLDKDKTEEWGTIATALMIGLAPLIVLILGLLVWGLRQYELEQFENRIRSRSSAPEATQPDSSAAATEDGPDEGGTQE